MESNSAEQYIFQTTVTAPLSTQVSLEWLELISGRELILARASKPLNIGAGKTEFVLDFFSPEYYSSSFDDDGDNYSNIRERR